MTTVNYAEEQSQQNIDEVLAIPFWDRTNEQHKELVNFGKYNSHQKRLLEIAKMPFYGRSDGEHRLLGASGFYIE
jgi:hypothetical protein